MTQYIELIRKNLLQEIEARKIPVAALEKKAGITQGVLSNFLTKRSSKTSFDTILSTSMTLGCTIDELLGIKTDDTKPHDIHVSWNHEFYLKVTNYICQNFQYSSISANKIIKLISEIYTYSIEENNTNPTINEKFARWLINKYNFKEYV